MWYLCIELPDDQYFCQGRLISVRWHFKHALPPDFHESAPCCGSRLASPLVQTSPGNVPVNFWADVCTIGVHFTSMVPILNPKARSRHSTGAGPADSCSLPTLPQDPKVEGSSPRLDTDAWRRLQRVSGHSAQGPCPEIPSDRCQSTREPPSMAVGSSNRPAPWNGRRSWWFLFLSSKILPHFFQTFAISSEVSSKNFPRIFLRFPSHKFAVSKGCCSRPACTIPNPSYTPYHPAPPPPAG